jgi:hypothetical protein
MGTFSSTIDGKGIVGDNRIIYGTYTDAQSTGNTAIGTGFGAIKAYGVSSITAAKADTGTVSGGDLTIYAESNDDDGIWWAIGK